MKNEYILKHKAQIGCSRHTTSYANVFRMNIAQIIIFTFNCKV